MSAGPKALACSRFVLALSATAVLAVAALGGAASAAGAPAAKDSSAPQCFLRREWRGGWKATPDARTIYIEVTGTVYRLDLAGSYPLLRSPLAVLHDTDASDAICTSDDFRLTVTDFTGVAMSPIVKRLTMLTPAEAAALPKNLRP